MTDSQGNEMELRRLHGGGMGWFSKSSPPLLPIDGCGCIACMERLETLYPLPPQVPQKLLRFLEGK